MKQESASQKRKRGRLRKPRPHTSHSNFLAQRSPTVDTVTLGTSGTCIGTDKRNSRKPRTLRRSRMAFVRSAGNAVGSSKCNGLHRNALRSVKHACGDAALLSSCGVILDHSLILPLNQGARLEGGIAIGSGGDSDDLYACKTRREIIGDCRECRRPLCRACSVLGCYHVL